MHTNLIQHSLSTNVLSYCGTTANRDGERKG